MGKIKRKPRSSGKPRRKAPGYTLSVSNRGGTGFTVTLDGLTGGNGKPRVTRCVSARSLKACLTRTKNKYGPPDVLSVTVSGPTGRGIMPLLNDLTETAINKCGATKTVGSR